MLKKRVERGSQRDCALNLQLFPSQQLDIKISVKNFEINEINVSFANADRTAEARSWFLVGRVQIIQKAYT